MADEALDTTEEEEEILDDESSDDEDDDDNSDDENGRDRGGKSDRRRSDGGRRSSGGRSQQRGGRSSRYQSRGRYSRRRVCVFCADRSLVIDWKKTDNLRRFVADSGAILPRRKSGLCAKHQRQVAVAIKRARHLALFPFTTEHVRIMGKS